MKCPVDQNELIKDNYEATIEVDRCPRCDGVWLDAGELKKIQETAERNYSAELKQMPDYFNKAYEFAQAKNEDARRCPQCAKPLEKREYAYCSQVMIDRCPSCGGIWLDRNELRELEIFFERSKADTRELREEFFSSLVTLYE